MKAITAKGLKADMLALFRKKKYARSISREERRIKKRISEEVRKIMNAERQGTE